MAKIKRNRQVKEKMSSLDEYLEYTFMELGDVTKLDLRNPMLTEEWEDPTLLPELVIETCRNPDYLHFFIKYVLNIEQIFPYQMAILQTLWDKPFPMIIATRGGSKCLTGDSLVITENGIDRIKNLIINNQINTPTKCKNKYLLGRNGFKEVSYGWKSGLTNNKKITTRRGIELEGTLNHPILIYKDGAIDWVNLEDVKIGDRPVIDRSIGWFDNVNNLPDDLAYLFGLLVGDGGYTVRGRISFTTADKSLIDQVNLISQKYFNKSFVKDRSKYSHNLHGVKIWDSLFGEYGFNSFICGEKDFPACILSAPKSAVAMFIRGLFDTDGCVTTVKGIVEYSSKSYNLVKTLQFVLLKFGIISRVAKQLNKKYNVYYYKVIISDCQNLKIFKDSIGFGLQRKQNLLNKHCLKTSNTNIDTIPTELIIQPILSLKQKYLDKHQRIGSKGYSYNRSLLSQYRFTIYDISYITLSKVLDLFIDFKETNEYQYLLDIYNKHYYFDTIVDIQDSKSETYDVYIPDDHSFISNGLVSHNSFLLSIYTIMRAVLHQGCKIVIVGSSLRQSLVLFHYISSIWDNAPVLRDIVGSKNSPKNNPQMAYWVCGNSRVTFLPLGDGTTIRGQRACVHPDTLIETNKGLIRIGDAGNYIDDIFVRTGVDQRLEQPSHFIKTKPIDAYKVTTLGGYNITCSDIHKLYTSDGFKNVLDLTDKDFLEFRFNDYSWPQENIVIDSKEINEEIAWLMGMLISEGSISSKHTMRVQMTDFLMVDQVRDVFMKVWPNIHATMYDKNGYIDHRGWKCRPTRTVSVCKEEFRNFLVKCGLERTTALYKKIPWSILQSPRAVVVEFLRGLFIGDGSCFLYKSKQRDNNLGMAYYSASEQLINDIQVLLTKLGIFSGTGNRKSKISDNLQHHLRFYGHNAHRLYDLLKIPKWEETYNNSYKEYLVQEDKSYLQIRKVEKLPEKICLYDFTIPEDHSFVGGAFRNHNTHILCDETASIDPNIFDTVIAGFAATKSDGVAQHVIQKFKEKELQKLGIIQKGDKKDEMVAGIKTILKSNQIALAGTAHYHFNHFYKRYCDYKDIITSGGNLSDKHDAKRRNANINSEDYAIIQLPYDKILYMMDENVINQAKMTMDPTIFNLEYGATFIKDSDGFFLASMLEAATAPFGDIRFGPMLKGNLNLQYVMGIDPASEEDRFSVNILELHEDHRRIVYQWSTNRKDYEKLKNDGKISDEINDYNTFFLRHIKDLIKRFNVIFICMDTGGGGISIRELLKDKEKCKPYEDLIIDMDDENNNVPGKRILKMIEFSSYEWRRNSHYALRADFMNKKLLFPEYDAAAAELDAFHSDESGKKVDRLDDCYYEILELKTETTLIKHSSTPGTNKESWDVPNIKGLDQNNLKKRLKRDRFTSLLLANWAARLFLEDNSVIVPHGDFKGIAKKVDSSKLSPIVQPYYGAGFNKIKNASNIYTLTQPILTEVDGRSILY